MRQNPHPYSQLNCFLFCKSGRAMLSQDTKLMYTLVVTVLPHFIHSMPRSYNCSKHSTTGLKNESMRGFEGPIHNAANIICTCRKRNGNSFITKYMGHKDEFEEAKAGIPSVLQVSESDSGKIMDCFLYSLLSPISLMVSVLSLCEILSPIFQPFQVKSLVVDRWGTREKCCPF